MTMTILTENLRFSYIQTSAFPAMTNFTGAFLTVEDHGCVYTVCTEGELFYAPIYKDGTVNLEEFDYVDFYMTDIDSEELEKIQTTLIDMMQSFGLYFKTPMAV